MLGLAGVFLSLVLLIVLAYRGINVIVLAPLMALLAAIFAGVPLLATYTQVFMPALGGYVITYFPLFLLGAVLGKLMDHSGSAKTIAYSIIDRLGSQRAILAITLACGVLTYGGVSIFVVAFAVFPIAAVLFREADIPGRLIPGTIILGAGTFTMTAIPGTPSIQNTIPIPFFGTTTFAAPGLGVIAGVIMFAGGMAWLTWRARRLQAAGEGYDGKRSDSATHPASDAHSGQDDRGDLPPILIAYLPVIIVVAVNVAMVNWILPTMNTDYLAQEQYGSAELSDVAGIWAVVVGLVAAIVAVFGLNFRRFADDRKSLNDGTTGSFLPVFNTASEVGYGAVIAALPAFSSIRDAVLGVSPNPLISLSVAVNAIAGITGSASGGLSIALGTLGEEFRTMATEQGIPLELMHRVAVISSGGFDAMPHNGAIITIIGICGMTHRKSYADMAATGILVPVIALLVVIGLGTLVGTF